MKMQKLSKQLSAFITGTADEELGSPYQSQGYSRGRSLTSSNRQMALLSLSRKFSLPRGLARLGPSKGSFSYSSINSTRSYPEDDHENQYSNSNISSSFPLEEHDSDQWMDYQRREKPPRSNLGCCSDDLVPEGHLAVYLGSRRRRFVVPTRVVTHRLFKKLLDSDYFMTEEDKDGRSNIVLQCDVEYFLRLLFLIDREDSQHVDELMLS